MSSRLVEMFEPIKVGQLQLKNRIVMLPVTTNYAAEAKMTVRLSNFYLERARGGAGLICFGFASPVTLVGARAVGYALHSDEVIPELRRFTSTVHAQGSKVSVQLCLRYDWRASEGAPLEAVGPTADIVTGPGIRRPRELTVEEIGLIVEQFAAAARRAQHAGFDMVEFHCGLGYLINRFISSATNKRTDDYGGSLEKRLRLPFEILQRTRQLVGNDYPLGCRISAEEFIPGGHTLKESKQVAKKLEKAGVDLLDIQVGWLESPEPCIQSSVSPGAFVYLAHEIKKCVSIPVVAAYRINSPTLANQVVAHKKADLVGMCRPLIADPYLPSKAKAGQLKDIRPCIACCECLDSQYIRGEPMSCSVNPWVGKEAESRLDPAPIRKRVFVIGGGPAGMQAAIVAAQRGHQVTLFEEADKLGGQLQAARMPPYKEEIAAFTEYLIRQAHKERVEIVLKSKITSELIKKNAPDASIIATGAIPVVPEIPGIRRANVANPVDVLLGRVGVGQRVVVVGGGLIGCETAEFLAKRGKQVTITSRQKKVGHDIGPSTKWVMRKRLGEAGVKMKPQLTPVEITSNGVWFQHEHEREFVEADTIVVAAGMHCRDELARVVEQQAGECYRIGDCVGPGRIRRAIEDGARVGQQV